MRRFGLAADHRHLGVFETRFLDQTHQLDLGKSKPNVRVKSTFLMEQPEI